MRVRPSVGRSATVEFDSLMPYPTTKRKLTGIRQLVRCYGTIGRVAAAFNHNTFKMAIKFITGPCLQLFAHIWETPDGERLFRFVTP